MERRLPVGIRSVTAQLPQAPHTSPGSEDSAIYLPPPPPCPPSPSQHLGPLGWEALMERCTHTPPGPALASGLAGLEAA